MRFLADLAIFIFGIWGEHFGLCWETFPVLFSESIGHSSYLLQFSFWGYVILTWHYVPILFRKAMVTPSLYSSNSHFSTQSTLPSKVLLAFPRTPTKTSLQKNHFRKINFIFYLKQFTAHFRKPPVWKLGLSFQATRWFLPKMKRKAWGRACMGEEGTLVLRKKNAFSLLRDKTVRAIRHCV